MGWNFADATYVVLISGKAGVGKTLTANTLVKKLEEFDSSLLVIKNSFAKGVKELSKDFGWDGEKDEKGRKLLQDVGRLGREVNEDFWVDKMLVDTYEQTNSIPPNIIIIDDWRFPNESNYFKDKPRVKLFNVRIEAPDREILKGTPEYNDSSETALDSWDKYNIIFFNYEDGQDKVDHFSDTLIELLATKENKDE